MTTGAEPRSIREVRLARWERTLTRLIRTVVITGALGTLNLLAIGIFFDTWALTFLAPTLVALLGVFVSANVRHQRLSDDIVWIRTLLDEDKGWQ